MDYEYLYCDDRSSVLENKAQTCVKIGELRWDNLGPKLLRSHDYLRVIDLLFDKNQIFFKIVQFCEKNENCYEIEIVRNNKGHHIFAACQSDLKPLINSPLGIFLKPFSYQQQMVKSIHNYQPQKEGNLFDFVSFIEALSTTKGIGYKRKNVSVDNFEKFKHLWFVYDLRKYCGDISTFGDIPYFVGTQKQFDHTVSEFHRQYVAADKPPSRQNVWKFLLTICFPFNCATFDVVNGLDWENVKNWNQAPKERRHQGVLKKLAEGHSKSSLPAQIQNGTPQKSEKFGINKHSVSYLVKEIQSINSDFEPIIDPNLSSRKQFKSVIEQYTTFLDNKQSAETTTLLAQKMGSNDAVEDKLIFAIYESVFNSKIVNKLKNQQSNVLSTLLFLFNSVKKDAFVGSFSVPIPATSNKKPLIIVVNNSDKNSVNVETINQELTHFIKGTVIPLPFLHSHFHIMYDNKNYTDSAAVNIIDASKIFKKIFAGIDVNRVDGKIVQESAVRSSSDGSTWTPGVTASTKCVMLSHMFLASHYKEKDYQKTLNPETAAPITVLIKDTTKALNRLKQQDKNGQNLAANTRELSENTMTNLFSLATQLEWILNRAPEAAELYLDSVKELNVDLASFLNSVV